jgi:hypothetical protein
MCHISQWSSEKLVLFFYYFRGQIGIYTNQNEKETTFIKVNIFLLE